MRTSRLVRSGNLVGVGQTGLPPTDLRTYETVDAAPTTALARPAGSIVHARLGTVAWIAAKIGGLTEWISTSVLYGLGYWSSSLYAIAAAYVAGWRPAVVVRDAAISGTSVTVNGLSAAKRYRIRWSTDDNGSGEVFKIQPDGSDANCFTFYMRRNTAPGTSSTLQPGTHSGGDTVARSIDIVLNARVAGISSMQSHLGMGADVDGGTSIWALGGTSTDYTSLTFVFSATARTGWLKIIEETP